MRPWLALYGTKIILADAQTPVIRAISCSDGRKVWSRDLPAAGKTTMGRIDTSNGPIEVGTSEAKLKSAPTARPCLMGAFVVVAGWYGLGVDEQPYLMAIDADTGKVAWTTPLGKPEESLCGGIATDGKRVYAVLASGKVR